MRFAIVDPFGCSLSFAARLLDEGHEVKLYHDKGKGRDRSDMHVHVGEGIVDLEPDYEALVDWASGSLDSLVLFAGSGLGGKADDLRDRGLIVVGGGSFCDRLENDRIFGQEIAEEAGAPIPPFESFTSLSAIKRHAKTLDKCVFFKADKYLGADASRGCDNGDELARYMDELLEQDVRDNTKAILQDKIEGVAVSVARWWNGRTWVGPYETTIEFKGFGNEDFGPSTGCSLNAVWFNDKNLIAERLGWENLGGKFREEDAPPGLYDINSIVDKSGTPYFLEFTPRLGYDSEPTSVRLIDDLAGWLWYVGTGQGGAEFSEQLAYSVRLSCPPYPWETVSITDKKTCMEVRVSNVDGLWDGNFVAYQVRRDETGLKMGSPEGIVGLSLAVGDDIEELHEEVIAFADEIDCSGLFCRTDGVTKLKEVAEALTTAGIETHEGLVA